MPRHQQTGHWVRNGFSTLLVGALWYLASAPWGVSLFTLAVFAGPGVILGLAASWAAHAFTMEQWDWDAGLSAALDGALALPPLVGFYLGWSSTYGPRSMIVLLVLGAWLSILGGLSAAAIGALRRRIWRGRAGTPAAPHVTLIR